MNPIAYQDQLQAAVSEVRRIIYSPRQGRPPVVVTESASHWLFERFQDNQTALGSGKARVCPHIGPSPIASHTAAWATDTLVCTACVGLLTPDDHEDARCDQCLRSAATHYQGAAARGPILMAYRLCAPCTRESGSPAKEQHHRDRPPHRGSRP